MLETYLIDTNVLIYAVNRDNEFHQTSRAFMSKALNGELSCAMSINNLLEFFAVTTDKRRLVSPLSTELAVNIINLVTNSSIEIINTDLKVIDQALEIAKRVNKSGQMIFDFVIASAMLVYGIKNIVTYNTKDFNLIPEIKTFKPEDIIN